MGDLTDALAMDALPQHRVMVDIERSAADVPAFKPSASHPSPDSLDNQRSFQLGDGRDDYDNGAAQRTAGVEVLPEANVLDV